MLKQTAALVMRDIPNCLIAYISKRTSPNKEVLGAGERGDPWVPASLLPQMLRQDTQVFEDGDHDDDVGGGL